MAPIQAPRGVRVSGTLCRRSAILLAILAAAVVLLAPACGDESPFQPPPPPVPCVYVVATTPLSFGSTGGTAQVSVSTTPTCAWTARSESAWVSITAGATGTGPGMVTVAAAPNASTGDREGAVIIADHTVVVRQGGPAACTYEISPSSAWVGKDGAPGSITVSAPAHCAWTAATEASWLTISSGATGSGNGVVAYQVQPNSTPFERRASIEVAGLTFTVTQDWDAGSCSYAVSPVTFSPCMTSTDMSASVTTQAGCPWNAAPRASDSWVAVVSGESGSGSGTVTFRVSDNWSPPRSGAIEIRWPAPTAGQNLHIAQAGCHYAVSRDAFSFGADGGSAFLDVYQQSDPIACGGPLQDACLWSATADAAWIAFTTSLPRKGDDRLSFTVAPNNGPARSATLRVQDRTVQITQAGK
jgi:hypothetical protein